MKRAFRDLGLIEHVIDPKTGKKKSNPEVEDIIATTEGKRKNAIATPWCRYWINQVYHDMGMPFVKSGMARAGLKWGISAGKSDASKWKLGDEVILWRGSYDDGVLGHVGFYLSHTPTSVKLISGNDGNSVAISDYPRRKILDVRRARSIWASRTVQSTGGAGVSQGAEVAVDVTVPDLPDVPVDSTAHSDYIQNTVDQISSPMQVLAEYKPWITAVLSFITIACILYAAYCRYKSYWENGR